MRLRPVSKAKIAAAAARFRWPGWRAERLEDRTLFSSPSDVEWLQQFGSLSPSATSGRAVDADGNVFLAGRVRGALLGQTDAGGLDAFVSKFDAAGNALWTRQFGTPFDD